MGEGVEENKYGMHGGENKYGMHDWGSHAKPLAMSMPMRAAVRQAAPLPLQGPPLPWNFGCCPSERDISSSNLKSTCVMLHTQAFRAFSIGRTAALQPRLQASHGAEAAGGGGHRLRWNGRSGSREWGG